MLDCPLFRRCFSAIALSCSKLSTGHEDRQVPQRLQLSEESNFVVSTIRIQQGTGKDFSIATTIGYSIFDVNFRLLITDPLSGNLGKIATNPN
jgi:hypothetical protein